MGRNLTEPLAIIRRWDDSDNQTIHIPQPFSLTDNFAPNYRNTMPTPFMYNPFHGMHAIPGSINTYSFYQLSPLWLIMLMAFSWICIQRRSVMSKWWSVIIDLDRDLVVNQPLTHYNDVIMTAIASQITSPTIVYTTVYSNADQIKTSKLRFTGLLRGIHRGLVNSRTNGQ